MDIIVDIIVPVFGIVGIGYVAARVGLFSAEATRGLSAFVFNFAIPALLFRTMVTTKLPPCSSGVIWLRTSEAYLGFGSSGRLSAAMY